MRIKVNLNHVISNDQKRKIQDSFLFLLFFCFVFEHSVLDFFFSLSHHQCLVLIHTLVQFDERFNIYKEYKERILAYFSLLSPSVFILSL